MMSMQQELERMKTFLVSNLRMMNRMRLAKGGATHDGKRDLYKVFGYKEVLTVDDFIFKYERQDIVRRIIDAFPDAIWRLSADLHEDEDEEEQTEFEKAFSELCRKRKLFHYLNRLDKLSGLGRYAVLFIGVRDGLPLEEPMGRLNGIDDILYLTPYHEKHAWIQSFVEDEHDERFGLPEYYTILTGGYAGTAGTSEHGRSSTMPQKTLHVHHSRVLHIAENCLQNDVFGVPRLEAVYNRLDDLEKVVGGSSEMFWLNGRGGLNLNADKDSHMVDPEKVKEHAEEFMHQLTRVLRTKGMDVSPIEFKIEEPDEHFNIIMKLLSGTTTIPERILLGSERGELASSQDENNWWSRVKERRENYCEPLVLRPLIDKFMEVGVLPEVENYEIEWPEITTVSAKDEADIGSKKAAAIAAYTNAIGSEFLIPPEQFVKDVLKLKWKSKETEKLLDRERLQMEKDQQQAVKEDAASQEDRNAGQS